MRVVGSDTVHMVQRHTIQGEEVLVIPTDAPLDPTAIAAIDEVVATSSSTNEPWRAPRMIRYPEAAEMLGVSTKWLQRRVAAGTIPCHQDNGRVWWSSLQIHYIWAQMERGSVVRDCRPISGWGGASS